MDKIVNKKKVKNLIPPNYYENLIKENPDEIFSTITQEKITEWENILLKYVPNKLNDDCKILIVNLDLTLQEQIKKDIERTKVRESILMSSFTQYLEFFLTYYCKEQNIFYKQGLNEIFAPFILLKYKIKISLSQIYNLIQGMINRFLPNYFYEKETFYSLKSSLNVTTLLLKYHVPTIYNIFDNALISPEMYATNLLLTLMAHKFNLNIIYYFWDILITNNDILFIYYFIVAFLKYNSEEIINSDITIIPAVITKLTIDSIDELKEIIDIAFELRKNTPHSFRILVNHLQIYKFHSNELQKCYKIIKPDSLITMPIFPKEIFYICYPNVKCPDEYCDNINDDDNINKNNKNNNNIECEFCNFYVTNKLNYIIIDLRILEFGTFEEENEKTGFLPQMIMLEQKELKDENLAENLTERFEKDKGLYHIILLTSKTNYFNDFEDDYYREIDNDNLNKYFQIQSKVEKELNTELTKKINKKKKFKLKEYDNLKKTLICMLKSNYPYISFAYGGFNAIHELSFKYKITLLNHDPNCDLCKKMAKNSNFFIKKIKGLFKNDKKKEIIESSNNENNNININKNKNKNKESEIDNEAKGERFHISLFSKVIQESYYSSSTCLLIEIHKKKFKKDNQIVLIVKKGNLEIYRVIQKAFQFEKLEVINIKDIMSINNKQNTNITTLDYVYLNEKQKKINDFLIIEFTDIEDCRKFIFSINQMKKMMKKGKREITELEFE